MMKAKRIQAAKGPGEALPGDGADDPTLGRLDLRSGQGQRQRANLGEINPAASERRRAAGFRAERGCAIATHAVTR